MLVGIDCGCILRVNGCAAFDKDLAHKVENTNKPLHAQEAIGYNFYAQGSGYCIFVFRSFSCSLTCCVVSRTSKAAQYNFKYPFLRPIINYWRKGGAFFPALIWLLIDS